MARLLIPGAAVAVAVAAASYGTWLNHKKRREEEEEELEGECQKLRAEIRRHSPGEKLNFRFLLFGVTGHGKSTLGSGLKSALQGDKSITGYFQSATDITTFSRGFCPAVLADNLWLIDMGGIFESDLFEEKNIKDIVEGRVPFYERLGRYLERLDNKLKVPAAAPNDVACVIIVMKHDLQMTPELRRKFRIIDDIAARGVVSRLLVVTNIETIDKQFKDPRNLVNIDKSAKIKKCAEEMSQKTGIPIPYITFVRNYWDKKETDVYTNLVLLKLLERIKQSGVDARERVRVISQLRDM